MIAERVLETKPKEFQEFLDEHKEEVDAILESLLPKGEVFRHPHYELKTLNDYLFWINMVKVRMFFQESYSPESVEDIDSLMSFFSQAHVIAMTGKQKPKRVERKRASYNGMSPVDGVSPGKYRDDRKDRAVFFSGVDLLTKQEIINWLQSVGLSINQSQRVSKDLRHSAAKVLNERYASDAATRSSMIGKRNLNR